MRSRESFIRLHKFQVDEKRRQVADIEMMIAEFRRKESELEQQVLSEQERSGITDMTHYAYPTFAKAAQGRRDNLLKSIEELDVQLEGAKEDLSKAFAELKKFELLQEKEDGRRKSELSAKEQAELDDVGLGIHRQSAISG